MAVPALGILGFEVGRLPASGPHPFSPAGALTSADINATAARSGSYGFQSLVAVAAKEDGVFIDTGLTSTAITGGPTWELRFRYHVQVKNYPSVNHMVVSSIDNGNSQVPRQRLEMDTTGHVRIDGSNIGSGAPTAYSALPLLVDTWYRVEHRVFGDISVPNTGSEVLIYTADTGVLRVSLSTSVDTSLTILWPGYMTMGQILISDLSCTRELWFDDCWWKWVSGVADIALLEWPRATKIYPFVPTGQGSSDGFAPAGGWQRVDEIPEDNAEFISSATPGATTTYTHAGLTDPDDLVYHIRNLAYWYDDTQAQALMIDGVQFAALAQMSAGVARYGLADQPYTNAAPIDDTAFSALQFGTRKLNGVTTLFLAQNFLEVLAGPPPLFLEDLLFDGVTAEWPTSGSPTGGASGGDVFLEDVSLATGTLRFILGNQGVDINVPSTWRINRVDVGYRDEETG